MFFFISKREKHLFIFLLKKLTKKLSANKKKVFLLTYFRQADINIDSFGI